MTAQPPSSNHPEDPKKTGYTGYKSNNLADYFKHNARETITYVLLVLGIVLLFFDPIWGGLIVGLVSGIYFGDEIVNFIVNWKNHIDTHGVARHLIFAGIVFAFLIEAPAIFLGAAIAIGIKHLFVTQSIVK